MTGPRAANLRPIELAPGFVTNAADRDAVGRYKDGNRVRFQRRFAQKMGGWVRQTFTGANGGVYIGTARALRDWSSLDNQKWIAIGTHCKLYVINNATLYDITPTRKSSNVVNPFATTIGLPTVTVTDPDHRANVGDYVFVTAAAAVGGLTLVGYYPIVTIPTPNTYTITAAGNASSTTTGGGSTTFSYDIYCGLALNGELTGYGTGTYGSSTYGTPRAPGSGVPAKMRIWSIEQWGEDIVASQNGGEIYWWQRSSGPNAHAAIIPSAPANVRRIITDTENRVLIALGCSNLDGTPDPMRIRWCSREDLNQWIPDLSDLSNTSGGKRLDYGSQIITGLKSRKIILVWTDTQLYAMVNTGDDYAFDPLGTMTIIGPNAAVDANGVAFSMGVGGFYMYDGVLRQLECDVWTYIFDEEADDPIDLTQAEATFSSWNESFGEVQWLYLKVSGAIGYVIFNYKEPCWYYGTLTRTAYGNVSTSLPGYALKPYAANAGRVFVHETGTDEVEGTTAAMDWFLETYDISAASDRAFLMSGIVPNFDRLAVGMRFKLKKKMKPLEAYKERGPYSITTTTTAVSTHCRGTQVAMRLEAARDSGGAITLGQDFRLAVWQSSAAEHGQR